MVKLNKIYTRTGDKGETGLGDGTRLPKHAPRVSAYGDIDETNAILGLAVITLQESPDDQSAIVSILARIQNDLFDLGADLCVPEHDAEEPGSSLRMTTSQVEALEYNIDNLNAGLEPLTSFVLPGGTATAAHLHHGRTVARRAERTMTDLATQAPINEHALTYINRLSDLLFVMARVANRASVGDVLWKPGGKR